MWTSFELPLGLASYVPSFWCLVEVIQLNIVNGTESLYQQKVRGNKRSKKIPSLIRSTVSSSTKLLKHIAMPHRIAPACPDGPPPSTLASTSTFSFIRANRSGNRTWKLTKFSFQVRSVGRNECHWSYYSNNLRDTQQSKLIERRSWHLWKDSYLLSCLYIVKVQNVLSVYGNLSTTWRSDRNIATSFLSQTFWKQNIPHYAIYREKP